MFSNAIVRTPCKAMTAGITTANLGKPNYQKALAQHADYTDALIECGLTVTCLEADESFPDSTFVEDTALLTPRCAIITNPGACTRTMETELIRPTIETFYTKIETILPPATVEAGDIMMVGDHYYIGLSERTNRAGADQMIKRLNQYGLSGSIVTLKEVLHLKTGLGYLENNQLLVCGEFIDKPEFRKYDRLKVSSKEAYAANSVWINGTVLTPKGFPQTKQLIKQKGYQVREVDVSEFQKIDGGLSCLSLRF
jgi:dimethylargininase